MFELFPHRNIASLHFNPKPCPYMGLGFLTLKGP
jgi:hypothetical protein